MYLFVCVYYQPPEVSWVDSNDVGVNISTKAVGKKERHDVTDDYKFPEGEWVNHVYHT